MLSLLQTSTLPSHFVAFAGDGGHLATARAKSTVVNIWPPPSPDSMIITSLESNIPVTGHIQKYVQEHVILGLLRPLSQSSIYIVGEGYIVVDILIICAHMIHGNF